MRMQSRYNTHIMESIDGRLWQQLWSSAWTVCDPCLILAIRERLRDRLNNEKKRLSVKRVLARELCRLKVEGMTL